MTNTISLENEEIYLPYKLSIAFGDGSDFTKIKLKSGAFSIEQLCWVEIKLLEVTTKNFLNISDIPFYKDISIYPNNNVENNLSFIIN